MFKTSVLHWQLLHSVLQEQEGRQMWDDRTAHIRFKTLRLPYKAMKWLSYIQSVVQGCMPHMLTSLCRHCGNLVMLQFGLYPSPSSRATHCILSYKTQATFHILLSPWFILPNLLHLTFRSCGHIWVQFKPQKQDVVWSFWRRYSGYTEQRWWKTLMLSREGWHRIIVEFLLCRSKAVLHC